VAEGELTTDSYALLDCFFESELIRMNGKQLQFAAGVENLANAKYRNHLSTNRGGWTLEPGRNFKCRVSFMW
jgi:outer membrane receptor protein involved in Fe transport